MTERTPPARRGRLMLIGVAALFFLPLAIAWWMFLGVDRVPEDEVVAHGELIRPARPLGDFTLAGVAGHEAVTDESLHGRWTLVYVGAAACDEVCERTLWEARQVHTRLGRDASRVQRLFVLAGADAVDDPAFFAREHADMPLVRADRDWLAAFERDGGAVPGHLYLVDPLGNLMMRYDADAPPEALLDDLKRLLRVSRIG